MLIKCSVTVVLPQLEELLCNLLKLPTQLQNEMVQLLLDVHSWVLVVNANDHVLHSYLNVEVLTKNISDILGLTFEGEQCLSRPGSCCHRIH